ncbi:hypothetical protein VNO77_12255 [Canavalia gladiata]|uniref:Uncharacterized protein n=1 Tax=Canavalia gladiata TaxID=3824 RepID=A0AAN9LX55_CANGL
MGVGARALRVRLTAKCKAADESCSSSEQLQLNHFKIHQETKPINGWSISIRIHEMCADTTLFLYPRLKGFSRKPHALKHPFPHHSHVRLHTARVLCKLNSKQEEDGLSQKHVNYRDKDWIEWSKLH